MNGSRKLQVLAGSALLAASMSASAGWVDLFTTEQVLHVDANQTTDTSQVADPSVPSSILGGKRDAWIGDLVGATPNKGADLVIEDGTLSFSSDSGVTATAIVQWDGGYKTGTNNYIALKEDGLGGIDLTEGGTINAFQYTVLDSDMGWAFGINVYSDAEYYTKVMLAATAVEWPNSETRTILFSSLENGVFCGHRADGTAADKGLGAFGILSVDCGSKGTVDFTRFGALEVILNMEDLDHNRTPRLDLQIGAVKTVPEPSLLALMGVGLLAGGLASRRRKATA